MQDVLTVLYFVHSNNVIHRDIKPQNIIRRQDGKLILIDFGAVKQVKQTAIKSGVTSKTIGIGTPGYMPSEQALGKPKFSSDVYALGMTAIQALTGKFPQELPEDNEGEIIWRNLVSITDDLATILTKMVRYRFSDRYENAGLVLQALNQAFSPPLTPPLSRGGQIPVPQKNQVVIPQISVTIPSAPAIKLQTSQADYRRLDQLLAQGNWKDADAETGKLMLKIMGRETEGWLTEDNCKNFPREELRIIDNLWVKYSQGRFGFSVQKQIWIDCGGTPGVYDSGVFCKFSDKVGWRKNGSWIDYSTVAFNTNAQNAHLPFPKKYLLYLHEDKVVYLFSRLD